MFAAFLGSTAEFLAQFEDGGRVSCASSAEDDYDADPSHHNGEYDDMFYTTPEFKIPPQSRIGKAAKDKLNRLIKTKMCLITCEKRPTEALQIAHVIPKDSSDEWLRSLEYAFGLSYKQFHVDSTRNIIILRSDMHISFDTCGWILIPEAKIVDEIARRVRAPISTNRYRYPNYKEAFPGVKRFKYTFVPLKLSMDNISIFRRRWESNNQDPFVRSSPKYNVFNSPYDDFPQIESHVDPFFAIANAGAIPERRTMGPVWFKPMM